MIIPFSEDVLQFAVKERSPETHSALISVYTWTWWELPSEDWTVTERYEKGSDCLTKSEGLKEFRLDLS